MFWSVKPYAELGLHSYLQVPLKTKNRIIGSLALLHGQIGTYGEKEMRIAEHLASQISHPIENARLYRRLQRSTEEQKRKTRELEVLTGIADLLAGPEKFEDKMAQVLDSLVDVTQAGGAALRIVEKTGEQMRLVAKTGFSVISEPEQVPIKGTLIGKAQTSKELMVLNRYRQHPRANADFVAQGLKSVVFFPFEMDSGSTGIVVVNSKK